MSRSPSLSSSRESYYSYSEVNQTDSFSEKPLLEIGVYYDTVESVPTEEEPAEYLEQLAFEEEEEQILLSFFFPGRKISEIGMFSCYEIQSFHNKNRENHKRYDRMCLLSVYFKTSRFASAHKIVSVYRS